MDERIKTLAYNLVHFSCKLEKGEKVWISCNGVHPLPLVKQIIKETYRQTLWNGSCFWAQQRNSRKSWQRWTAA